MPVVRLVHDPVLQVLVRREPALRPPALDNHLDLWPGHKVRGYPNNLLSECSELRQSA